MITIRFATLDDCEVITAINITTWRATYGEMAPASFWKTVTPESRMQHWQEMIRAVAESPDRLVLVAEINGTPIGYIHAGPSQSPNFGYTSEVYTVYVLPDYHGHGAGKALIRHAMDFLHHAGHQSIVIRVARENPSRHFYQRLNGTLVGMDTFPFGNKDVATEVYGWQLPVHLR